MNFSISRFLREPLVQFLLLGAGLFALYSVVSDDSGARRDRIVVDAGQVTRLAGQFERTWLRPPTQAELDGLIEDHVREEILYREARALGLDKDDLVIRRRLRQKMEFLNEDLAAQREPTEAELQAFLDAHQDRFRIPSRLSFRQVFLNLEKRGPDAPKQAAALLARLDSDPEADLPGDATLLPPGLTDATTSEIARTFGGEFAVALEKSTADGWTGPIESGYGLHLVRVTAREPARVPSLAEARSIVAREWSAARRAETNEAFHAALRKRYDVSIEKTGDKARKVQGSGKQ